MALRFSFKPGSQQSIEANRYFMETGAELLQNHLPPLDPEQLLLANHSQPPLPLRIWTARGWTKHHLADLVPWLGEVARGLNSLARHPFDTEEAKRLAWSCIHARWASSTLFLEMLNPAHAFTADEDAELSVGVVAGEVAMLSARNVMFVKLANGLFGLSIARMGSVLVERVRDDDVFGPFQLRRA